MLVKVFQKQPEGWQQITQYYRFHRDYIYDADLPLRLRPKEPCPGCGKVMTSLVNKDHRCLGGAEGWPRISVQGRRAKK